MWPAKLLKKAKLIYKTPVPVFEKETERVRKVRYARAAGVPELNLDHSVARIAELRTSVGQFPRFDSSFLQPRLRLIVGIVKRWAARTVRYCARALLRRQARQIQVTWLHRDAP